MVLLLCILAGLGGVAAAVLAHQIGFYKGKRYARTEEKKRAQERCHDGGLTNPFPVLCPCMCQGTLQSDGRNTNDNLTFLICNECKCCYVARDAPPQKAKAV